MISLTIFSLLKRGCDFQKNCVLFYRLSSSIQPAILDIFSIDQPSSVEGDAAPSTVNYYGQEPADSPDSPVISFAPVVIVVP